MKDYDVPACSNCKHNDTGYRGGTRDQGKVVCYKCEDFKKFEPLEGTKSAFIQLKRGTE